MFFTSFENSFSFKAFLTQLIANITVNLLFDGWSEKRWAKRWKTIKFTLIKKGNLQHILFDTGQHLQFLQCFIIFGLLFCLFRWSLESRRTLESEKLLERNLTWAQTFRNSIIPLFQKNSCLSLLPQREVVIDILKDNLGIFHNMERRGLLIPKLFSWNTL